MTHFDENEAIARRAWVRTVSGRRVHLFEPRAEEIDLEDIAHSLALQCRYNGHTPTHFSVAQHSVWVSELLEQSHAGTGLAFDLGRAGLFHDAAEAYVGDMVRPLKLHMPTFAQVEDRITYAIADRFALPRGYHHLAEVELADRIALAVEARDIIGIELEEWGLQNVPTAGAPPLWRGGCWPAARAYREFLARASYLGLVGRPEPNYVEAELAELDALIAAEEGAP